MASRPLVRCYFTSELLRRSIGLPDEVEIVGGEWDPERAVFALMLRGDRFPLVHEGDQVPIVQPILHRDGWAVSSIEWPFYGPSDTYGVKS